jgi:hypothetical protein
MVGSRPQYLEEMTCGPPRSTIRDRTRDASLDQRIKTKVDVGRKD